MDGSFGSEQESTVIVSQWQQETSECMYMCSVVGRDVKVKEIIQPVNNSKHCIAQCSL